MSNLVNDAIIDGLCQDVADMDKVAVMNALNDANLKKVAGFVGNAKHGANIVDFARDVLVDQMFNDLAQ
tara:strand:- start:98 stop:304 length:207 start_codon:yes stop_codon:yes gene_type:complete